MLFMVVQYDWFDYYNVIRQGNVRMLAYMVMREPYNDL